MSTAGFDVLAGRWADASRAWEPPDRDPPEPHQVPPEGVWPLWLLEGGRSCGKTEACSRYFARHMRMNPGHRGRIIAPTQGDAITACVEGPSGLLSIDPDIRWLPSAPGGAKVLWPNGSEALVIGTPTKRDVDRLRAGGNRHLDWYEEAAANVHLREAWHQAQLGLRLGWQLRSIASTTPKATEDYKWFRRMPGVVLTHATIYDNKHNPPEWIARMEAEHGGTALGRQELLGELVDDLPGALWQRKMFDETRVDPPMDRGKLARIVVAVDPALTDGSRSNDTGIVVAGVGVDEHAYVLEDRTCHLPPDEWARMAVYAYNRWRADRIVAEQNQGFRLVESVLRTVDASLPVTLVTASRGKLTRAEPVAALYEQGRVHHVGPFPELEDQCATYVPGESESPDRMDALVWALTELLVDNAGGGLGGPWMSSDGGSRWAPVRASAGMGAGGIPVS